MHCSYNKYTVDILGGDSEILLNEVEGHSQGNQGNQENRSN